MRIKNTSARFLKIGFLIFNAVFAFSVHATAKVLGADPARHDRFYQGADKQFIFLQYDLSGIGKVVSASSKWATMVAEHYFLSSGHAHPEIGEVVRFYFTNNPADGFVDRVVAGGEQIKDNSGLLNGDVWLGYFTLPVPDTIAKYPVLGSSLAFVPVGSKLLLFGKANDGALAEQNPLNQRAGRNICISQDAASSSYQYRYDAINTADSLGVDENSVVQGDSGAPTFTLVDNQLALVGTRWGYDLTFGFDLDTSVIAKTTSLGNAISRLSLGAEQLRTLDIPTRLTQPVLFEDFEMEQAGKTTLVGRPTTTKHQIINVNGGGHAEVVAEMGNKQLKLISASESAADSPKVFFETLANGIAKGDVSMIFKLEPIATLASGKSVLTLRAGDDIGLQEISVGGAIPQSAFQLDFTDKGTLNIYTSNGVFSSDQNFSFGTAHFLAVKFNLISKNFFIYIDGKPITANAGAVKQFSPQSSVAKIDAIYLASHGLNSTQTISYLDDLRISEPGGWRNLKQTETLSILGARLEADAFISKHWQPVPNSTGSNLEIANGSGNNEGSAKGISRGGITGLNSSEIEQIINLEGSDLIQDVDSGNVSVAFSAAGISYQIGDFAQLWLEFLGADKTAISKVPPATINDGKGIWTPLNLLTISVPKGTRAIRIVAGVTRSSGITTDAYIDGLVTGTITRSKAESIIPIDIKADAMEQLELVANYWQKVPNSTGVYMQFSNPGLNNIGASGAAIGGITGFNSAELTQIIDLSSSSYLKDINAKLVTIRISAFGLSYQVGDFAQMRIEFLNISGSVLAVSPTVTVNDGLGEWQKLTLADIDVPPNTRKIRLVVGLTRTTGVNTDAYIDGPIEAVLNRK